MHILSDPIFPLLEIHPTELAYIQNNAHTKPLAVPLKQQKFGILSPSPGVRFNNLCHPYNRILCSRKRTWT